MLTIDTIEKSLAEDSGANTEYQEFVSLIKSEMSDKLKPKKNSPVSNLINHEISRSGMRSFNPSGKRFVC